ncbi:response regulator [Ramlibacter sp. MAHUQ-53]|uniref:response regulator n=1 Tax=unclassified Ramlibacter TaxID=2617605 RepID=UPI003634715E
MNNTSLKTRLTLFTLLVFLVGIWSLTFLVSRILREDMSEVLGREQFSVVSILAGFIEGEVSTRIQVVSNTGARLPPALMSKPEALTRYLEDRPIYMRLFNSGIFVTDATGVAIASLPAGVGRVGQNFMDRDFIAAALREGKVMVGKPVAGRLQRGAIIGIAAPVRDAKGDVIGVVAGITNLSQPNFLDVLTNTPYGKTGGFLLTSPADYLVITATDKSRVMTELPKVAGDRLMQRFRDGIEGYGVGLNPLGVERIAAAKNIPSLKWQVVGSMPTAEGFEPIRQMERHMQLLALALSVLAGGLTWWWLRRQFQPLSGALRSLEEMTSQGGQLEPLPVARNDEVGGLIRGFNGLLEVVQRQKLSLAEEREKLGNIISGTGAGTWVLDLDTGEAEINERWAGMLGYTADELRPVTEATWAANCHPDDHAAAAAALARYLGGEGDAFEATTRMRHRDGHWVWVQTRASVTHRGPDGRPLRLSGLNIDVNRAKQAEEAVARTSAMLAAVLDSASGVAIIAIGADRRITVFNKGAENLLGYSAQEVVGLEQPRLFLDPQETARRLGTQGLAGGLPQEILDRKTEWTLVRKDGSRLQAALWITRLVEAGGQQVGYLGVGYDISQEKRYEQSLIEAKQQAEAATEAKSRFLSNMSHEIRTPMNAILGLLQLLQTTPLTARQLDYAAKTEGAARSLLGLINDILDLSKLDADKMSLDLQPFRLDTLLRDLSAILSTGVNDKPVEVLFDIEPHTPKALVGDLMRLKQVLINLGGNAIKFTLAGTVVLQIRVVARTAQETTLRFAVIDTGIGIAPGQLERIFEGFSQAESSTTRRFGGTGLGLSISRQLVKLMGGTLAVDSVQGQGSTFGFTVTLANAEPPLEELAALAAAAVAPMSVLVVDDNALARDILTGIVSSWGWAVETASSGTEAIARVTARAQRGLAPYQVLLVDWYMPQMDGWATLEALQALYPADAAPLSIMVTAHDKDMLRRQQAHAQARLDGYLVKPLTASMLYDAVMEAKATRGNAHATRQAATGSQALDGLRILLVEDNPINQQVAQELLASQGAQVEVAGNGRLGVDALLAAKVPFDVVLMDLQMPEMDGLAATRLIRETPALAAIPVVAMTANAMASDREKCLAAGMNDHVGKPFDLADLVRVLLRHTGRDGEAGEAGRAAVAVAPVVPAGALDAEGALQRMDGRADLYGRVLHTFLDELGRFPAQLDAALAQADRLPAVQALHTLKGLAGTVGAVHLADVACQWEQRLKDASAGVEAGVAAAVALREAIDAVSGPVRQTAQRLAPAPGAAAAARAAGAEPVAVVAEEVDADPEVRAGLAELRDLFGRGDMRAVDLHSRLQQRLAGLGGQAGTAARELERAVAGFDFVEARAQCEILAGLLSDRGRA